MLTTKVYFTDLIGNDYKSWDQKKIILNGGTGCGKTHFTINTLIPYYIDQNKTVLYLCNRTNLYKQLERKLRRTSVKLMTYQALQRSLRRGTFTEKYDLIIADECHYFYIDAKFNGYTDLSYGYVMSQSKSTVVFLSATADGMFSDMITDGVVAENNVYTIPKVYDYVEKVYTYTKNDLTDIIDNILADNEFEKILIFVNSMQRLIEMHDYYGDSADYMCSESQQCKFASRDCIVDNKFPKRLLFTTKVLDNGVDLVDDDLRHIFCELFDIDSTLQSIGRKRSQDYFDTVDFYFRIYDARAINNFYVSNQKQLNPVHRFMDNKEEYLNFLDTQNKDTRSIARKNKIFYVDMRTKTLKVNRCALKKYEYDKRTIEEMRKSDYETVLFNRLGDDLKSKKSELKISTQQKDVFQYILEDLEGKKLFKDEQTELKERFRDVLGLHDRTMGINTLNGKLMDCNYKYEIVSIKERSRKSEYYNKRYWMIQKLEG